MYSISKIKEMNRKKEGPQPEIACTLPLGCIGYKALKGQVERLLAESMPVEVYQPSNIEHMRHAFNAGIAYMANKGPMFEEWLREYEGRNENKEA